MDDPRHAVAFCSHFAGEARVALDGAGLHAVRLVTFPARCHHAQAAWEEIERVVDRVAGEVTRLDVFCSACCFPERPPGSGREHCRLHLFSLCAYLVAPRALVDDLVPSRAYLLTSGWLRSWRQEVAAWGFEAATAREFLRESADSLVLLDTGVVPEAGSLLAEFSAAMDLPSRCVPVGTEVLRLHLERVALEADLEESRREVGRLQRTAADLTMALDVLAKVATVDPDAPEVLPRVQDLLHALFAPRDIRVLRFRRGEPGPLSGPDGDPVAFRGRFEGLVSDAEPTPGHDGILLRLRRGERPLAWMALDGIAFPEFLERYVNLARSVADVLSLALFNEEVVSEARDAAARLDATRRELERSNADLERFAYAASHDLQEPLRTVIGFSDLLERRAGAALDDQARHYLDAIREGGARMKALISDLLEFSRVGQGPDEPRPVAMDEVLGEVLAALQGLVAETGAVVERSLLPVVLGRRTDLARLLQNLIHNAIKFRAEGRPPVVQVSCERRGPEWRFTVRDNGVGFDPALRDRVFEPFRRLDRSRPGTGLGLALCRRVVEQHGGRIEVESEPGRGSVFHFAIPVYDPDRRTEAA